jgi:hypothetical protein
VSTSSLRWWSWKLGSTRRRGKSAKTTSVSPLAFVEMTSAVRGEPIEIVPRILKEGLARKKLKAKGQKRATTYFTA